MSEMELKMLGTTAAIVAASVKRAAEGLSLEEKAKLAIESVFQQEHDWIVRQVVLCPDDQDKYFRLGLAVLHSIASEEERPHVDHELKLIRALSDLLGGGAGGEGFVYRLEQLEEEEPEGFEPLKTRTLFLDAWKEFR